MDTPLVAVPVGACRCPGTPHADGDIVYLYPDLPMSAGLQAQASIEVIADGVERLTAVYLILIEHGIADWTFTNGESAKVPINPATIRGALPWGEAAQLVKDKALELYGPAVMAPFMPPRANSPKTGKSSPPGLTAVPSTSPRPSSRRARRAH